MEYPIEILFLNQADGQVKINDGDLVIGTGGHGIDFSAQTTTSVTGATVGGASHNELLNHYECGTWTPTVSQGSIHTIYSAHYIRVGSLVYIQCYTKLDASSSSSEQYLGGLPFNITDGSDYCTVPVNTDANLGYNLVGQINLGSPGFIAFAKPNNVKATGAELSGKFVLFSGTYQTNL